MSAMTIGGATVIGNQSDDIHSQSIPLRVTAFQAKAALHEAGFLSAVESMMANSATPKLVKLAWSEALHFERYSPTVLALGAVLRLERWRFWHGQIFGCQGAQPWGQQRCGQSLRAVEQSWRKGLARLDQTKSS